MPDSTNAARKINAMTPTTKSPVGIEIIMIDCVQASNTSAIGVES